MRSPLPLLMSATLLLSACGDGGLSRLNPFNWFGGSTEQKLALDVEPGRIVDPRPLVAQVIDMRVDRMPGGAIVRAVGLPPTQGYWQVELLAENAGLPIDGALVFQFRAFPPVTPMPPGTQPSRELTAATFVSDQDLAGVRVIVVKGARNQRSARR